MIHLDLCESGTNTKDMSCICDYPVRISVWYLRFLTEVLLQGNSQSSWINITKVCGNVCSRPASYSRGPRLKSLPGDRFRPSSLMPDGKKKNSVALVRKRTIPTERPSIVGEVSANFCGQRVLCGQRNEFPRPLISVFQSSSSSIVLTRLSGPRSRPPTS
jgi:hypothetical protein